MKFITIAYYPPHIKRVTVTKGGSGSGNFGHEGRPGLVGGSAPGTNQPSPQAHVIVSSGYPLPRHYSQLPNKLVAERLLDWETKHTSDKVLNREEAILIDDTGEILELAEGDIDSVEVPRNSKEDDAIVSHNHPPVTIDADMMVAMSPYGKNGLSMPPSDNDVRLAIKKNHYQVRAVGYNRGKRWIWTVTRPEGGWNVDEQELGNEFNKRIKYWASIYSFQIGRGKFKGDQDDFAYQITRHTWLDIQEKYGIEYYEGELL